MLGVGTGRLIQLLNEQARASDGSLLVVSYRLDNLQALVPSMRDGPFTPVHARPRQIPVLSEAVDLLVMSGVLREVPLRSLEKMLEEVWRVVIPGGKIRVCDIMEPSEAKYNEAWRQRSRIVRRVGRALDRPTALSVDLQAVARAVRAVGFEDLAVSILPGYALTDAWIEQTVNALRTMASRVSDVNLREALLHEDLDRLLAAYARGKQRAAERFVLKGAKAGDLALTMEASFNEENLVDPDA